MPWYFVFDRIERKIIAFERADEADRAAKKAKAAMAKKQAETPKKAPDQAISQRRLENENKQFKQAKWLLEFGARNPKKLKQARAFVIEKAIDKACPFRAEALKALPFCVAKDVTENKRLKEAVKAVILDSTEEESIRKALISKTPMYFKADRQEIRATLNTVTADEKSSMPVIKEALGALVALRREEQQKKKAMAETKDEGLKKDRNTFLTMV